MRRDLEEHYPLRKAAEILGVHPITLRRWEKAGKIPCTRTPSGQRRFPRSEILRLLGEDLPSGSRVVIYARVSSAKQAGAGTTSNFAYVQLSKSRELAEQNCSSLERQKQRLEEHCRARGSDVVAVIAEQGSGLNEKRKGLLRLFKMAREGKMDLVVVEFKDRLARFGFTYIERYLNAFGVKVEVVNGEEPKSLQEELVQDMLSILTVFRPSSTALGARSSAEK